MNPTRRDNRDPAALHRSWIGLLQPDGIVVSAAALVDAGLSPDPLAQGELDRLRALCGLAPQKPRDRDPVESPQWLVGQALARCFVEVFGCDPEWLHGTTAQPFPPDAHGLLRVLTEFNSEELSPSFALENPNAGSAHADRRWLCLLKELPPGFDLDSPHGEHTAAHWPASPMAKFERLLRETNVPIGVIANDTELRLVYAPPGEGAGVMTFPLALLLGPESDVVLGALVMLLGRARWLDTSPDGATTRDRDKQFLPHLLEESRKYQNTVSTALAEQVLDALWELLRGLQSAHIATQGALLRDWINGHPDEIYGGLLAVLLRLVFLLYAEDRGQLPAVGFYPANYGVRALYEKLRDDDGRHPDTMNLRLGAWARLLATFRLVHDGGGHGAVQLPAREGSLFSPDTYAFLEGRPLGSVAQRGEALDVPAIPDGVVLQVLEKLLRVEREDLSYKTLGVEELGSVYESMMGFTVLTTTGHSLALKPDHVVVDLQALLQTPGKDRAKTLADQADAAVSGKFQEALRTATTIEQLADALAKTRSARTPGIVPPGSLVLQPTLERRRSGSHYTPRALTAPIVERTLRPVFTALGEAPTHEQILAVKVCDPAMGSGAFLVAACRWLGDRLYDVWQRDGGSGKPVEVAKITPDDDERLVARRLVAQHCLYGVDKNPFAVNLARLSLWLETLAKEHPFTFLDHVLREGDSLVGVTRQQVEWVALEAPKKPQKTLLQGRIEKGIEAALRHRAEIRALAFSDDTARKMQLLDDSRSALSEARLIGDALLAAFFAETTGTARRKRIAALSTKAANVPVNEDLRAIFKGETEGLKLRPFHWELEFPEVFTRENRGFDAVVGNPPFMGGTKISEQFGMSYFDLLTVMHPPAGHHCDLVAYFFRRVFDLLRTGATAGLIATNTIGQGDTREGGLRQILSSGGAIYRATSRYPWPGLAALVTSIVHFTKGPWSGTVLLNGRSVARISAFLFAGASDDSAVRLEANPYFSLGSKIYGQGFLFDDDDAKASPTSLKDDLLKRIPDAERRIRPYIGGEELNSEPTQHHHRWVIFLSDVETEEQLDKWPELRDIVRAKVKPERDLLGNNPNNIPLKRRWWAYQAHRPELYRALTEVSRTLANSQVSAFHAFAWQPTDRIFSHKLNVFPNDRDAFFAVLQSRTHELWARFFASTLEDRLNYSPSDCFETFPFPERWETNAALDDTGRVYYEFRAQLMVANNQGLTTTYNRFHDPDERSEGILHLRVLHAAMDRAVLDAYGWADLQPTCEFLLEYEAAEGDDAGGRKKKPWRYRWPDAMRDEVLARLLTLNGERAAEERAEAAMRALRAAEAEAALKVEAKAYLADRRAAKKTKPAGDGGTGEFEGMN